jgi:hypothetical protein
MAMMIEGQSHFPPFGLSYWGFADLNRGVGSMTASYDYHIGVDYHKSYSHLVVQDSNGKTLRSGRVKNDRQSLGGFPDRAGPSPHQAACPTDAGLQSFNPANATLDGIEMVQMMRKRQGRFAFNPAPTLKEQFEAIVA